MTSVVEKCEQAANVLRALGNPARLRISIYLLGGERTVGEIEASLRIRQPNLSQHLAALREAGIVMATRRSRTVSYRLDEKAAQIVGALMNGFGTPVGQAFQIAHTITPHAAKSRPAAVFAKVVARDDDVRR